VKEIIPLANEYPNFISYLKRQVEALKATTGAFTVMEMSRKTLNDYIVNSAEFGQNYKMIFGGAQLAHSGGLMTDAMVNQLFTGIGLPPIRVVEDFVVKEDGTVAPTFDDKRIVLLPQEKLGKMLWHEPYEISDPIPTKTYTRSEGGMYISNIRTDEGRFMEYGAEWFPVFTNPNKIVNFNLVNF
jgi:hypothetical protein